MPYLAGDVSVLSALRELNSVGKEGQNYFIIHDQKLSPDALLSFENKLVPVIAAGVGVEPGKADVLAVVAEVGNVLGHDAAQPAEQEYRDQHKNSYQLGDGCRTIL